MSNGNDSSKNRIVCPTTDDNADPICLGCGGYRDECGCAARGCYCTTYVQCSPCAAAEREAAVRE